MGEGDVLPEWHDRSSVLCPNSMADWILVLPKFVMRHLETEAPTGIGFMHYKFFNFVDFDPDTPIFA